MTSGPKNALTDIADLRVGSAHDHKARTGVTVVMPEKPAIAAVDVRGGGPGTRETDALALSGLVERVDAIVLAGGSVYGLAAADRIAARLGAVGRGFSLVEQPGVPVSPIVPSAILYDLNNGGDKAWDATPPYSALADQAFEALSTDMTLGRVGAGFGATAGAYAGGLGSASAVLAGGICVAALVAVNSFGSPYVPGTEQFWAAPFEIADEFGGRGVATGRVPTGLPPDTKLAAPLRANTTIAVVATNATLTKAECARVAIMAQDGLARAIRPAHGPTDGDTVFAMTTGEVVRDTPSVLSVLALGTLAGDVLARAIARGVYAAEPN